MSFTSRVLVCTGVIVIAGLVASKALRKKKKLKPLAVVVGGGAQGMACAHDLNKDGWQVVVVADHKGEDCVSGGAGAIWDYPPFKFEPAELGHKWLMDSRAMFDNFISTAPESGAVERYVRYFFRTPTIEIPEGAETLRGFQCVNGVDALGKSFPAQYAGTLPAYLGDGLLSAYWFPSPVLHMRSYLPWLRAQLQQQGVQFLSGHVTELASPLHSLSSNRPIPSDLTHRKVGVVVNCTGLGARKLCGDKNLYGIRGIMVLVKALVVDNKTGQQREWLKDVISDESFEGPDLCYIVPQRHGIVGFAGCAQTIGRTPEEETEYGFLRFKEGSSSQYNPVQVCEEEALGIMERCTGLIPVLKDFTQAFATKGLSQLLKEGDKGTVSISISASETLHLTVKDTWAGLRPARHGGVRFELESLQNGCAVIHNYGHGGSGVVTSWGCAASVASMASPLK